DKALVLARTFKGKRVLFMSDLGRPGQEALLARTPDLSADILVSGLPENREGLSEGLVNAVNPRVIVVCDSEFPAQVMASAALEERLNRRGALVLYTRLTGSVTIEFSDNSWVLRTMSGLKIDDWPPLVGESGISTAQQPVKE